MPTCPSNFSAHPAATYSTLSAQGRTQQQGGSMVNMPPPPPWFLPLEQQMHYWSYWMSIYPMHQHQFQPRFNCNFNRSIKSIFKVNNVQHFNLDPLINGGSVSQQVVQPTEVPKANQVVEIVPNVGKIWTPK